MKTITAIYLLIATVSHASPVYETEIYLSAQDAVTVQIGFDARTSGVLAGVKHAVSTKGDGYHGKEIQYCKSELSFEGAMVSLTVLDSARKVIAQSTQPLIMKARHSTRAIGGVQCPDPWGIGSSISASAAGEFVGIDLPYSGKSVRLSFGFDLYGSVQIDGRGNFAASVGTNSITSADYFINNGHGIDPSRGDYRRGSVVLVDRDRADRKKSAEPTSQSIYCQYHPYDCKN